MGNRQTVNLENIVKRKCLLIIFYLAFLHGISFAGDAGSRAAFTRGGWAGSSYVGMGMAGEIVANDVFAIYWNPAGLNELKGRKVLTEKEIRDKASKGKAGEISESDLIRFTDETVEKNVFQVGASGAKLGAEMDAGFSGLAFSLYKGVFGIGMYSLVSRGIEERDNNGNLVSENLKYVGAESFLSYGWSTGIASIGFSLKGLYEKIGNVEYAGAGSDFGMQVYFLPFLKVGFVIQDIGSGLTPYGDQGEVRKKYDFALPSLKVGASITSDTGLTIAFTGVKRLEQKKYQVNTGLKYILTQSAVVYAGMHNSNFSSGFTLKLFNFDLSYAFTIDSINFGYNNIVSIAILF